MTNEQLSPCFFLYPDLEDLNLEIERVQEHIRETKLASQEGTEQSSESWHDNYIFEEAQRQLKMLMNHLGGLSRSLERSVVVDPPDTPECVEIGATVTFFIKEERRSDTFSIGSYMVFDRLRDLDFISYETPIAVILNGARVGDERVGEIGGKPVTLVVQDIRSAQSLLPEPRVAQEDHPEAEPDPADLPHTESEPGVTDRDETSVQEPQ